MKERNVYFEVQIVDEIGEVILQPNKLICSQLFGFIAQLIQHCTGIAQVMGSNPVGATRSFQDGVYS